MGVRAAAPEFNTRALNRAVKRNAKRFRPDFMFQLTADEAGILKCQNGISGLEHGGRRRSLPYAFTEQGVAMESIGDNLRATPWIDRHR